MKIQGIIVNGENHIWVPSTEQESDCVKCSLRNRCYSSKDTPCEALYADEYGHFEEE
jgi:hypothetical protein